MAIRIVNGRVVHTSALTDGPWEKMRRIGPREMDPADAAALAFSTGIPVEVILAERVAGEWYRNTLYTAIVRPFPVNLLGWPEFLAM